MGDDKRESIIASALELFRNIGYHNTKVSDIVKAAGIAQGTFYLYFKSKEDLFRQVVEACMDEIVGALDRTPSGSEELDGETVMYRMIRQSLLEYYKNRNVLYLINRHGADSPELSEVCKAYYDKLAQLIIRTLKHYCVFPGYTEEQLEIEAYAKIGMVEKAAYHCFIDKGYGLEQVELVTEVLVGIDCGPCKPPGADGGLS